MSYAKDLVNYTLIDANKRLVVANTTKAEAVRIKQEIEANNPDRQYVIEPFAVGNKQSSGGQVVNWQKTEGYSLWQVLSVK